MLLAAAFLGCGPSPSSPGQTQSSGLTAVAPVVAENELAGSDGWRIRSPATNHEVEGYASAVSATAHDSITLQVSCDKPRSVRWELYRLGDYEGLGGRLISSAPAAQLAPQPACPPEPKTGLIECHWQPDFRVEIAPSWVSGQYLFKLIADESYESYIPLVVREHTARAAVLVQVSVTTWQAYNDWGGASLYANYLPKSSGFTKPMAETVSFDRPYGGASTTQALDELACAPDAVSCAPPSARPDAPSVPGAGGDLLVSERWMIQWLEHEGFDVAYVTNLDVDADPKLLTARALFMSVGHDEYWSLPERDSVQAARDAGMSLAFFGANSAYWRIRLDRSSSGVPNRTMTCFRSAKQDPISRAKNTTVRYRDQPFARPEAELIGVMYQSRSELDGFPQVVTQPGHWIYEQTGVHAGDVLSNIVGAEWDGVFPSSPKNVEVVAHAITYDHLGLSSPADVTVYAPTPRSFVFAAGSIDWSWGLGRPGYADARIERMTENVLVHAGAQPAYPMGPVKTPIMPPTPDSLLPTRTLAGSGTLGHVDGAHGGAEFAVPAGVAVGNDGTIYVADEWNRSVRVISPTGVVTTLAGRGAHNPAGASVSLDAPTSIVLAPNGTLYVSDTAASCIRAVSPDGRVMPFAGTKGGSLLDAQDPLRARFSSPHGLALGPHAELYVADSGNNAIRRIDALGVSTVTTEVPRVTGLAVAADGTIYASSDRTGSVYRIRDGHAEVLVNQYGTPGYVDGPAGIAMLRPSDGLLLDGDQLIIADGANYRLRTVSLSGPPQVTTLALDGDTANTRALHTPRGIALAPGGYIVADSGNHRIVYVERSPSAPLAINAATARSLR